TFELKEDDPGAFELFIQWLYTGTYDPELDSDGLPDVACHAWALGDKLQCPSFQDRAMCQLIAYFQNGYIGKNIIRLIYDVSMPGSMLRTFAVDQTRYDLTLDSPPDQKVGAAEIMAVKEFTQDFLDEYGNNAEDPFDQGTRYMKVLNYHECGLTLDICEFAQQS
ncbi:MAG: hypothetical protein Q9226_008477, partial [Calogaya cf. arnoldii]